jgi:hypothetical protein
MRDTEEVAESHVVMQGDELIKLAGMERGLL